MYKLSFEKRAGIVKQVLRGMPRVRAALSQGVSDRAVREIMGKYRAYGWDGLKDHITDRPEIILHPNAEQENTLFRQALDPLGIKHCLARINRPQTNGKGERFFLTYKTEFMTGTFTNVKDHIHHYNEKRLHISLNYRTPKEVWDELSRV